MKKKLSFFLLILGLLATVNFGGEIDKSTIPILKWTGPGKPGTYQEYLDQFPVKPFILEKVGSFEKIQNEHRITKDISSNNSLVNQKVVVIVNKTISSVIKAEVNRYINDIRKKYLYRVILFVSAGGSPQDLKNILLANKVDLIGGVLIGNLPVAWYEIDNDFNKYGYAEFPCDLFFMDLDGLWIDSDLNGKYDSHVNGSGDTSPEIFISRIDASIMSGEQNTILKDYFEKNHDYWIKKTKFIQYGSTYTEDDWSLYEDLKNDIKYLYPKSYQVICAPDTDRVDYLENRLKNFAYKFLQLACHSWSLGHSFTREGDLTNNEVKDAPPQAMAYNLFCCSSLRFTERDYLGGTYIFNESKRVLTVIGSTKSGSMLEFHYFYKSLGENKPIGIALKEWFEKIAPYNIYDISWHYGMNITGDPLLNFCVNQKDFIHPPTNIICSQEENFSLTMRELINIIKWDLNTNNSNRHIAGYKIYSLRGEFKLLGEVNSQIFEFYHRNVKEDQAQGYAVVAIDGEGREGLPAVVETK